MGLSMLPSQLSPIAVDVGTASVKVLQVVLGEAPSLHATAELEVPDPIRIDVEKRARFLKTELPGLFRAHGFRGRRVVCAPLATQVLVRPVQVDRSDPLDQHALAGAELEAQLERMPGSLVVRSQPIARSTREGRAVSELLCWAMTREDSMRYVDLFRSFRYRLVGLHPQVISIAGAFPHLNRRSGDASARSMYVDLGWGGMKVAIAHGGELVFAKQVQIGGRQLDELIAERSGTDTFTARIRRIDECVDGVGMHASTAREPAPDPGGLAMLRAGLARGEGSSRAGTGPVETTLVERRDPGITPDPGSPDTTLLVASVDCSELLESMSDELAMCVRHHARLFPGRGIDRLIFLGGESRNTRLCRGLARSLHVPAQLGDPLARFAAGPHDPMLPEPGRASPSWGSACGLCTAPVDL